MGNQSYKLYYTVHKSSAKICNGFRHPRTTLNCLTCSLQYSLTSDQQKYYSLWYTCTRAFVEAAWSWKIKIRISVSTNKAYIWLAICMRQNRITKVTEHSNGMENNVRGRGLFENISYFRSTSRPQTFANKAKFILVSICMKIEKYIMKVSQNFLLLKGYG